jgi:hypothetical protein
MECAVTEINLDELYLGREFRHAQSVVKSATGGRPEVCRITKIGPRSISYADEQGRRHSVSTKTFGAINGGWV